MTTEAQASSEKPRPQGSRALGVAFLVACSLGVAGLAFVVARSSDKPRPAASPANPRVPTAATMPSGASPLDAMALQPSSNPDDLLVLSGADEALKDEPADMPAPGRLSLAGVQAQREGGFRRSSEGVSEEFSFWSVKGATPAALMDAYEAAAAKLNFRRVSRKEAPQGGLRAMLSRAGDAPLRKDAAAPAGEALVIRAAPEDGDRVRLTLWFRYAMIRRDQP